MSAQQEKQGLQGADLIIQEAHGPQKAIEARSPSPETPIIVDIAELSQIIAEEATFKGTDIFAAAQAPNGSRATKLLVEFGPQPTSGQSTTVGAWFDVPRHIPDIGGKTFLLSATIHGERDSKAVPQRKDLNKLPIPERVLTTEFYTGLVESGQGAVIETQDALDAAQESDYKYIKEVLDREGIHPEMKRALLNLMQNEDVVDNLVTGVDLLEIDLRTEQQKWVDQRKIIQEILTPPSEFNADQFIEGVGVPTYTIIDAFADRFGRSKAARRVAAGLIILGAVGALGSQAGKKAHGQGPNQQEDTAVLIQKLLDEAKNAETPRRVDVAERNFVTIPAHVSFEVTEPLSVGNVTEDMISQYPALRHEGEAVPVVDDEFGIGWAINRNGNVYFLEASTDAAIENVLRVEAEGWVDVEEDMPSTTHPNPVGTEQWREEKREIERLLATERDTTAGSDSDSDVNDFPPKNTGYDTDRVSRVITATIHFDSASIPPYQEGGNGKASEIVPSIIYLNAELDEITPQVLDTILQDPAVKSEVSDFENLRASLAQENGVTSITSLALGEIEGETAVAVFLPGVDKNGNKTVSFRDAFSGQRISLSLTGDQQFGFVKTETTDANGNVFEHMVPAVKSGGVVYELTTYDSQTGAVGTRPVDENAESITALVVGDLLIRPGDPGISSDGAENPFLIPVSADEDRDPAEGSGSFMTVEQQAQYEAQAQVGYESDDWVAVASTCGNVVTTYIEGFGGTLFNDAAEGKGADEIVKLNQLAAGVVVNAALFALDDIPDADPQNPNDDPNNMTYDTMFRATSAQATALQTSWTERWGPNWTLEQVCADINENPEDYIRWFYNSNTGQYEKHSLADVDFSLEQYIGWPYGDQGVQKDALGQTSSFDSSITPANQRPNNRTLIRAMRDSGYPRNEVIDGVNYSGIVAPMAMGLTTLTHQELFTYDSLNDSKNHAGVNKARRDLATEILIRGLGIGNFPAISFDDFEIGG